MLCHSDPGYDQLSLTESTCSWLVLAAALGKKPNAEVALEGRMRYKFLQSTRTGYNISRYIVISNNKPSSQFDFFLETLLRVQAHVTRCWGEK